MKKDKLKKVLKLLALIEEMQVIDKRFPMFKKYRVNEEDINEEYRQYAARVGVDQAKLDEAICWGDEQSRKAIADLE